MRPHPLEFRFYYFTPNYDAVVAFYRDGLGLEIVSAWNRGPEDRGTVFRSPNGVGMIEVEFGQDVRPPQGGVYVEVEDVDVWYEKAVRKGLGISQPISDTTYGHRTFKLADPDGLEIGFFTPIP